ncbi:MAG: HD domain-containing protein [Candidatus Phytoplasma australasiaticum]|nr:HD domain-containing protein [Candidatus Phytoplasma australasiaticum]
MFASLLHDIGHSSYSHIFERVFDDKHEDKTIQMIINDKKSKSYRVTK